MHAPENNYLTAKSRGAASAKMEAEFLPCIGETWRIVGKDRFPFSVIYRFEFIFKGARSARGKTVSCYLSEGEIHKPLRFREDRGANGRLGKEKYHELCISCCIFFVFFQESGESCSVVSYDGMRKHLGGP